MATFTLKANVDDLTGADATKVTTVKIKTLPGPVADDPGQTTFEWETTKNIDAGVLEVLLPQDATPSGYVFHVTFPQLGDDLWWEFPPPVAADTTVWLSDYVAGASLSPMFTGLTIGDVTTGAPGTDADVELDGLDLNFTIPRGNPGPTGPQGVQGDQGLAAPGAVAWTAAQAVSLGSVRQAPDGTWIKSLAARTTGASFNATEQAFWITVSGYPGALGGAGTLEKDRLEAVFGEAGAPDAAAASAIMRPHRSYIKEVLLDASQPGKTADGIYTTFAAAATAIDLDQRKDGTNTAADAFKVGPSRRRCIWVAAGDYNEIITPPLHCDVRALPGLDVKPRFYSTSAGSGAVVQTTGRCGYFSGLKFESTATIDTFHAHRDAGPGGDADQINGRSIRTLVFDTCEFVATGSNPVTGIGGGGLDLTPGAGVTIVYNKCLIDTSKQSQAINLVTNTSGANTAGWPPSTYVFIDCKVVANKSNPVPDPQSNPVGFIDAGSGRRDRIFWYGGSFDVIGQAPVYAPITCFAGVTYGSTPKTLYHISPEFWAETHAKRAGDVPIPSGDVINTRDIVNPRLPVSCESVEERRAQYPDAEMDIGAQQVLTPGVASTGQGTLTANRIYYVRVPITVAMYPHLATIGVGTAAGNGVFGWYLDDFGSPGAPSTDTNMRGFAQPDTLRTGIQQAGLSKQRIWPGLRYIWLAFAASSATATVDVVANATGAGLTVKYQDGWGGGLIGTPTGLADLPSGQNAPYVKLYNYDPSRPAVYRAGDTWTLPTDAIGVWATLVSGGGGGGSGRRGAAATVRVGGGPGAPGPKGRVFLPADALPSRTLALTVGTGGGGGAAVTANDTNGNAGGGGNPTFITSGGVQMFRVDGAAGGAGGTATTGLAGVAASSNTGTPATGPNANVTGGIGDDATNSENGAGPGAPGGGVQNTNTAHAGGRGGGEKYRSAGGNGGATGSAGSPGARSTGYGPGGGGGGGGGHASTAAGAGGAGVDGGGGGGGGASLNGNNSGAGGAGGNGMIVLEPVF